MTPVSIEQLSEDFAVPGRVTFDVGPGGLPVARLACGDAQADVCLYGAHVLRYAPAGTADILMVSRRSMFREEMPIRGGIPVCWPWFGKHPELPTAPLHGYARTAMWRVVSTGGSTGRPARLVLRLTRADAGTAHGTFPFELELAVTLAETLTLTLTTRNTGTEPLLLTQALHTYLAVGDAARVTLAGLDGCPFRDKLTGGDGVQSGDVTVDSELDRIFLQCPPRLILRDPVLKRTLIVSSEGSRSAVVWNPWQAKAAALPDFGDEEYRTMLCVETANAPGDEVCVAPGASHALTACLECAADG